MAEETKFCGDCRRETVMFEDHSQGLICTECGLVVEENNVDTSQDVRIFEDNIGAKRVEEADPSGNGILGATLIQFSGNNPESMLLKRCQQMQLKSMKDDKLKSARSQITEFSSTLNISSHVTEYAQRIYDELIDAQNNDQNGCIGARMRGKKHKALLVGCLYYAGSQLDQPKSLDAFAAATGMSKKEISHARKFIQQQANNINVEENHDDKKVATVEAVPAVITTASNVPQRHDLVNAEVSRICSRLQFSFRDRKCAEEIAVIARSTLDIRKAPNSQAAAIVWICMHLFYSPLPQNMKPQFLQVISVSLGTLRQTYSMFLPHLQKILPRDRFGEPRDWENKLQRP